MPSTGKALWFGLCTYMHREDVRALRWERINLGTLTFRARETKAGVLFELPASTPSPRAFLSTGLSSKFANPLRRFGIASKP